MDIDIIRDRLTPKQIKFCILLVERGEELSAKECAIQAGYSEKAAIQSASNLKQIPHVAEYIRELRNQEEKKYEVNLHNPRTKRHLSVLWGKDLEPCYSRLGS